MAAASSAGAAIWRGEGVAFVVGRLGKVPLKGSHRASMGVGVHNSTLYIMICYSIHHTIVYRSIL